MRLSQKIWAILLILSALYFLETIYLSSQKSIDNPSDAVKDNSAVLDHFRRIDDRIMWQNPPLRDPVNQPLSFSNKNATHNHTHTSPSPKAPINVRRTVLTDGEFRNRTRIFLIATQQDSNGMHLQTQHTLESLQTTSSPRITILLPQSSNCSKRTSNDNNTDCTVLPYHWDNESQFYEQAFTHWHNVTEQLTWSSTDSFVIFITDSYLATYGWFEYFRNFAVLLEEGVDRPTFAITAWNAYGYPFLASNASSFYRTEIFVGKMWMTNMVKLNRVLGGGVWHSHSDWEISMQKLLSQGHFIYPEVSRAALNIPSIPSPSFTKLYERFENQNPQINLRSTTEEDQVEFGNVFKYTSENYFSLVLEELVEEAQINRYLNAVLHPSGKSFFYNAPTESIEDWYEVLKYLDIIGNHSTRIYNYYQGLMIFRFATNLLILRGLEAELHGSHRLPDWTVPFTLNKQAGAKLPNGTAVRISSFGKSCEDVCSMYGDSCEEGLLHGLDYCNKLMNYLPCRNGCQHFPAKVDLEHTSSHPLRADYRINSFAAPLYHPQTGFCITSSIRNLSCKQSDPASKRLCLCRKRILEIV